MHEEDLAANVDENQTDSPSEDNKEETITRVVAKRLSEEKEKIRQETLDSHAISLGYESYSKYMEAQMDDKLIQQSLDPQAIKPVLQELLHQSPEYQEALKYKKEKEELEKQIWADAELTRLNEEFGTRFKDISELDENTISLWNNGLSLIQSYAANNYKNVAKKTTQPVTTGKEHLKPVTGSGGTPTPVKQISKAEIEMIRNMYPHLSEAQIRERIN